MTTKAKLEPECGIKPDKQIIKFKGKKLDDDFATLSSYGIEVHRTFSHSPNLLFFFTTQSRSIILCATRASPSVTTKPPCSLLHRVVSSDLWSHQRAPPVGGTNTGTHSDRSH